MDKQAYIVPMPGGWALVSYGDEVVPDDELVPLPLTQAVGFEDVMAFVCGLPAWSTAYVDGWDSVASMVDCGERELAARAGWVFV